MFKALFIIALILIGLYFSAQGLWMMHISAFGFEISLSAVLLFILLWMIWYLLHLSKKPWPTIGSAIHCCGVPLRSRSCIWSGFLTAVWCTTVTGNGAMIFWMRRVT